MSSDLQVKISAPIDKERLLSDCVQVFSGLLNISSRFDFAFFDGNYVGPELLGHNVQLLEFGLEAQLPWITEDKAGTYAFATTGGIWPLGYVVVATLVIAVARQSGGLISDDSTRWIKPEDRQLFDNGYDVDCFFQALRNPQAFEDIGPAAAAFYGRLPVQLK